MLTVETLYEAAQQLSPAEREDLAERLLADGTRSDSPRHPAWAEELKRRSADLDAGAVAVIPWGEVRDRARRAADLGGTADA